MPSLKLADAWKDFTPPSPPDVSGKKKGVKSVSSEAGNALAPDAGRKGDFNFQRRDESPSSLAVGDDAVMGVPDAAGTPGSEGGHFFADGSPSPEARSLFDRPLMASPLLSSSSRTETTYRPDPQRMEELNALILHSKNDPDLDALLERNPAYRSQAALDDGSMPARALLGQQILREVAGERYAKEPGFYFLALKEKLPESATRQEAYAAVYDHYRKAVEKQYEENKARKAAYQKNRAQVDEAVAHVVGGLWSPAELGVRLTPEQTDVYLKEFDTGAVEKANAAFSLLKQVFSGTPEEGLRRMVSERAAMKITSALSDDDGNGKLTINETAFNLFEGSLHQLMGAVKEQSGDEWKFLHNMRLALFNSTVKRDATLASGLQLSGQQNLLVPFAREHNAQVFGLMEETVREYQAYIKNDRENARVLGLLSTGQDLGNQSNEHASFAAKTVNCLGSVCGQTAPFFVPYAGWGVALAGAYDDKRNRAYYDKLAPGTAEWSAFVDAAASVAVEKISYGALGKLSGAGWVMGKLPFMGKTRKALTDSLWKHVVFEAGAGIMEETFVEPTAEAVIQWAVRSNIAPLAGVEVGGSYDWSNYWNELKGMMEPDQLLATALFVGGLAGGTTGANSLIMQRSLVVNSRSPEMLMMQGIPEDEAKRISRMTDNGERVAAVREAVSELKTLPPEEVQKNASEGVKAFRSLTEVRATVESEAYKFFQKEMRLPLVEERLDKPGVYNVTVFDVDSGQKKFTQEMTEGQLVSLFGNYFSGDKRTHIAEAQSAFAANAFLRTAEKGNVVQAQDMLQWGKSTGEGLGGNGKEDGKDAGKMEIEFSPETGSPGSPVPAATAAERREKTDSSGSLEDGAAESGNDSAVSEGMSVLGKFVRTLGGMSQTGFSYLTRIALDEWDSRLSSGMSGEQAADAPFAPLSPYAPLGSFLGLEKAFRERLKIAGKTTGEEGAGQTGLFQMGTAPGTSPADILFLVSKGLVGTREMLEDLFEVGIKSLVKGDRARLETMGGLLRETQAGLQKLGFQGQFISPTGPLDEMKVVEGMSKLALSDTLINAESLPLPRWQKDLLQYHVNYLNDASYLLNLGSAWNLGRERGTITKSMEDILRDLGHRVHTIYDQAKIEQQDIQAVMEARAIVFGNKGGPGGSAEGPTASQIRERQQRDEEEEKAHVTTGDKGKERTVPKEALQHPETVALPEAPDSMQGVFVNGASYNPDAGTWIGMVPVDKLHLSPEVPQVKVNSGKKGVVNPLVGDYRADAPPVYVWKRRNGKLEVVSGRHRLDLAQRTGTKAIAAYVYEEDANHDARWARLLDYEQNMQDDQADELTAAIYVRETSLTDNELTRRGLTRSGTRSRRGLLIGREAREDLWARFRSGAIKAQDAEAICLLTQHIQDKGRVDSMQMTAANDLAGGKSLEFVAARIQLMAHASADGGMVQGLISFGESFEQDMERAAEYVARCISTINEHINAIKGVRSISRKGNVLSTEGITAGLSSDPAERLKELELLKTMYEKIGLYENLRVRALTWDGHTPPDPIGDHRLDMQAERARAEADAAALEDEENRKAAGTMTPEFSFSLSLSYFFSPSSRVEAAFPFLWRQAEKELNGKGRVSFSLNGSRVAIYTFPEREIRKSLVMGGMVNMGGMVQEEETDSIRDTDQAGGIGNPANRREVIPFGFVPAGEIACILHPESLVPLSRMDAKPEAAGSGKLLSLSDFSGFIIPSSLEGALYPELLELGVPVRVYHVTGEEAAFLGDSRSMEKEVVEKDGVENDGARRKGLDQRRNNVIRSFLEETDVSFSLSAAERRIAVRARRENTWMKAPDGTPTALTERQWLQVHSEAFREWFGESKIVNEHGEPVVVYHGTARADRVGTVFRGDRATSGPMAFFTDHENIAANYAKDKRDTSIGYEAEDYYDYHQQFRVVLPDGQDISLERYWNYLSPSEQRRIATLAGQIREDWDGDNSIIVDPSIHDANGGFPYHLQEARGNAFRALVIQWLESAILLDEEHRFLDVLEKLDLPLSPYYRDPDYQEQKVYACYMRMENPFRTARITKKIISSLKSASKKSGIAKENWRTDLWDKNSVSPEDWIERLENDYENKTTRAWASIPDWVTACLRKNGYDGIIDQGGKFHAEEHTVCIPFDSGQIKSATDNRGTFDPGNADITFSLSNLAAVHSLEAEKLAAADRLGGLPLPSLAVTRLDRPYTWGDDESIYLVGSPALADPARGVEIYDRDMWSGHFPELRWNRREEKEREDFYRSAEQAALRYYGGTDVSPLHFLKKALDGDHRGELENKLRHSDLSLAVFAGERGYAPRPLMAKIPGRLNTGDKLFYSEIYKLRPDKHANFLTLDRQEEFCAAMERAIERYRTQFVQDSQEDKLSVPQTLTGKSNLREMEKELKEAREGNFETISVLALIDAQQTGKTVPDWEANFKRFEKYAATHKKDFDTWVQDKMERWLNPVPRIKENGFPATLDNITRYMLGSKGNGAEYKNNFFSTGLLRAKKSRRFHSLDQIKENRDILVTSGEYDVSQEKAQGLIHQFQETLYGIVNDFSAYNKAVEALSLIEGEPTPSKVLSALSRLYRGSSYRGRLARNSGNLLGLGAAALHAMKSELRDYYETVPQRAVQLDEFSHAVMPASLRKNKQIRDILKRHGIRPLYHDGTLEGRTRAMASLMGSAASFSLTAGGASEGYSDSSSYPSRFQFPTSDFMASLSEEERIILEKALASGTWMKAPNGEGSRLTPRQWVQVRTAAFRDWFGEWLEDPGHASQVVDENGEPRVVYHGTRGGGFTVFDRKKIGANWGSGYYGKGFYFTDNRSAAYHYGHNEITCFLNIRNPYLSLRYHHEGEKRFTSNLKKKRHDGVIGENALRDVYHWHVADGYEYVAFNESQIKSATENVGSFDSSSPDITFSVIGLRAETWKQYKNKAFTGRDDGMLRAEIDASKAALKDRSEPYLEPLHRELAALRQSLSGETKKKIGRFLSLHWTFYRNKKGIEAEDHPDLWKEYLSLGREREEWSQLLTEAFLRAGLYHSRAAGAAVQAQLTTSLQFLLREDEDEIRALAHRAADNTVMTLDEWLDYPELFEAYPKLRSMPVIFRYLEKGVLGLFSPAEWTVYLDRNTSDPQKTRSILLHEIQHSIQQIEGFAKGGTEESARQFYEFMRREAQEAYDQSSRFMSWLNARDGMISSLEYMLSLARNPSRVLRTSYLYSYDNVLRRLEGEERILDMVRYALEDMSGLLEEFYQADWNRDAKFDLPWPGDYALNTPAGIKECLKAAKATPSRRLAYRKIPKPDLGALYRNLLKYEKLSGLSSHELYRHLAGEIEARNVQSRGDWAADFREDVPFNDTLEYPGEALVSFSLGDGLSPAPEPHSLPGSAPLQNVSQHVWEDASHDSLQNEYETEQSIHASSGPASFSERSLLPRAGEGHPGRGQSDEPAAGESHGAGEGRPAGNGQTGSALPDEEARRETDTAHSGQFDPAVGVLGIKAYSLSLHLTELAVRNRFYTGDIVEIENSAEGATHFRRCLEEAKSSQIPYGECVYTYDAEEYEHMRLFLLPSGKAGFALKDGDMVSVFSHKRHGHEGKPSYALVALAVQMGAIKGDCYGTILPDLYAQFGFRAVARDRFNMEFAPESMQEPGHMERWYSDQEGKPDVVYLVYRGNRARVVEEFDPEAESGFESLPYSDFDACQEIQSRAVEAQLNREATASEFSSVGDDSFPLPDSAADSVSFSVSPLEMYKDGNGKIIRHKSVVPKTQAPLLKRASFKEGEFCRVERVFRKSNSFDFTSRNKVESTADIAYIFRQLENASVENVFAVYIKSGQPIVQHISMGGIDSSIVECGGIVAAMGRIKPEAFYLVHNHPSGSLNASAADINTHQRLRRMFGNVVQEGIIIDTTSGYFAVFDSSSPREHAASPMPGQSAKEQPVSLYAFDRAVFSPDWNPSKIARISGPEDIAAFISGHRLGQRKKISLLIFNTQLQIVANIHTRYTSLTSPGLAKHIAECTAVYGGWHVAVYGDFTNQAASPSVSPQAGFNELQLRLQPFHESVNLVDAIQVNGNHYSSLASSYSSYVRDGERDISSFSLTSIQKVVSSLTAPSIQATRAAELVKDCDKAAENWRRIMSGKAERPSARVGAELFGMVGSFLSAARYVLPKGYRSNVDMQMQWASVYAAMAESGEIPPKGTLRSGEAIYKKFEESMINTTTTAANAEEVRDILAAIGSQRLDRVMEKILDRVRGQLIRFAKDELYLNTMKRVEVIYPKKEAGRKSPRGRMEAQAYRAVARYREMLGATAQVKAEAMEALEARFNTEEDEEKRQENEEDIIAWKTYGDYAGMSLVQAQAAMEKLLEFVMAGRNSWADKLRKEGGRTKYAARQIQKNLPVVNSASSRAGAKIRHRTKLRKLLASLPYSFMSYAQLMLALEPLLGQRFSRARIKEISDANAALLNASNDRSAWLFDTICRIAGVKSESAAEQWLVKFNTPEKTDIPIAPVIVVKVVLSIEEAQEWLSLSREEQAARRKEIREEDRRTEIVTENVPEEEDILLLRQALDEYEEKSPEQQQYQKNVTSLREVPNEEATGILTCSRDCALYAILLHEQPDYADMYDEEGKLIRKGFLRREGLDDEGISALYDFVGPDGLEYGYALRKRLQETGKTLAQVYEERMGVPFMLKENYFRATFDRNSTKEKDALTEPKTGAIGGGKYGLLIDRIIHSENLDFSKAGTLVFLAAAAEQDNYIYTSHITTAWRALLKNKVLEQKLKQHLGEDMMGKLSAWMDLIDGASLENNRAFLNLSRMQGMLQKAFAVSVLAGNGYVLLKQSSAILHGFFSGWVPSAVLERADGTRELAHRHISFADYLFHLAASKMGLGDIGLKEVMETPYFQARVRGKGAMLAQIGNQTPGQRYSRMEKLPEKAMDLIEWVDVKANLHAMHALANAYYAKAKALNETNGSPFTDEQLRKAALEQVGMSLELGAQPLTKTQKSMNQAAGGILSKLAFVMKSEQLNKLGMMAAEWKTGTARNRVCAAQSWLALGVTSSLLAWLIAWIKGLDDDDDDKKWRKYGTTALLGDLTTIPLAGEGVNYLASLITGERVFADSYARTLVDVQGIARTVKKEYEHVTDEKEMDWDTHFNNLTALVRAAGVGGAFSRSSSAVVSSYGALSLAAATGANISRTGKDLLSALFRDEEERKEKKKRKRNPEKKKP